MKTPDFDKVKREAIRLLSFQEHMFELAVDVKRLIFNKTVIIDSLEQYAWITGIDHDYETHCKLYYGLQNGCTIRAADGTYLILYDDHMKNKRRQNWSLAHEVGHIYLGHESDGPIEEVEANFFAAQILAPDIVIKTLVQSGVTLTEDFLYKQFFLSREAAGRKLHYLRNTLCSQSSPLEEAVLDVFSRAIRSELAWYLHKKQRVNRE